jgi:hypothetical protein
MVARCVMVVVPVAGADEIPRRRAIHVTTRSVDEERDSLDAGGGPVLMGGL